MRLSSLVTSVTNWPTSGDYEDGIFGGLIIARGNRFTQGKPPRATFCSTNPNDLTGRERGPPRREACD